MECSDRKTLYKTCKEKLLRAKEAHLSRFQASGSALAAEIHGDDGDIASAIEEQDVAVSQREKVVKDLKEIEAALHRIEIGNYGMCEETEEPIEEKRLLALPWTRLSLEGALIREREARHRKMRA